MKNKYITSGFLPKNYLKPVFSGKSDTVTYNSRTYTLQGTSTKTYGFFGRISLFVRTLVKTVFFRFSSQHERAEEWICVKSGKRQVQVYQLMKTEAGKQEPDNSKKDPLKPVRITADKVKEHTLPTLDPGTPQSGNVPDKNVQAFNAELAEAKSGKPEAMFNVGTMYLNGTGVDRNFKQAYIYLSQAEEESHPGAKERVAEAAYLAGKQCEENAESGISWFKTAKEKGHAQAAHYLTSKNVEAFNIELSKAGDGNPEAIFKVGTMYLNGTGVDRDFKQAYDYFIKAKKVNYPHAMMKAAEAAYRAGEQWEENTEDKIAWFHIAVENGHAQAAHYLRVKYQEEVKTGDVDAQYQLGVIEHKYNPALALKYYEMAAIQKPPHPQAARAAGMMYLQGSGGTVKNPQKAIQYLKLAASLGDSEAAYKIGLHHQGCGKYDKAAKFFKIASEAGYKPSERSQLPRSVGAKRKIRSELL